MIKNYTSGVPVDRTLQNILKILSKHGAKQTTIDYSGDVAVAIFFTIEINGSPFKVKLPARLEKVPFAMWGRNPRDQREKEQVYRTAWKNIHDWIDAQMALIETEMVKLEEVFLPYFVDRNGLTFYESLETDNFKQLSSGPIEGEVI
jgi:hypothetical protein